MGRKQIYYAANTVGRAMLAKADEFILEETLEPYVGVYHIANETYLSGASPTDDSKILLPVTGTGGTKFTAPNPTKYFELTRLEFTNHTQPEAHFPTPSDDDYINGQFQRYFVQKINEPQRIYEISDEDYRDVNIDNKVGINGRMWKKFEMQWMITKVRDTDAAEVNIANIAFAEKEYPGITAFLPNVVQFYSAPPPPPSHFPS